MNCKEFWDGIDSKSTSSQLQEHLNGCDNCRQQFPFEQLIQNWTEVQTRTAIKVPDTLWERVEKELVPVIQTQRGGFIVSWLQRIIVRPMFKPVLALTLALSFLVPSLVLFGINHAYELNSLTASSLRDLESAEQKYVDEIEKLSKIVGVNSVTQTDALYLLYNERLIILDGIIAECKQALLNNELNIGVRTYLMTAYKEKVDTLEAMSQLVLS